MKKKYILLLLLLIMVLFNPLNSKVFAEDIGNLGGKLTFSDYPLLIGDKMTITYSSSSDYTSSEIFLTDLKGVNASFLVAKGEFKKVHVVNIVKDYPSGFAIGKNVGSDNSIKRIIYEVTVNGKIIYDGQTVLKDVVIRPELVVHSEITNPFVTGSYKDVSMTWTIPDGNKHFVSTKIYKNGVLLTTVPKGTVIYKDTDVMPETPYTYKFVAVYNDGFETNGIASSIITEVKPTDPALIPPSPVSLLTADSVTSKSVDLSWLKPDDEDLNGFKVYKNGALIEELTDVSSFKVTGLSPNNAYTFAVSAVDTDGNESTRQSVSVTTADAVDDVAPDAPKGLTLTGGNNALYLKWNKNLDDDLLGYNVYVNGVKDNSTVVKNSFYSVAGLKNSDEYQISISAVDKSGNESVLTAYMNGVPTEEGMPILSTDYELLDVAKGVEAWFSSMWLIIAFAVAIPLSFYIGARIKLLFLS